MFSLFWLTELYTKKKIVSTTVECNKNAKRKHEKMSASGACSVVHVVMPSMELTVHSSTRYASMLSWLEHKIRHNSSYCEHYLFIYAYFLLLLPVAGELRAHVCDNNNNFSIFLCA